MFGCCTCPDETGQVVMDVCHEQEVDLFAEGSQCSDTPAVLDDWGFEEWTPGTHVVDVDLMPGEYLIEVQKRMGSIGVDVEMLEDMVLVSRVHPGPVQDWNDARRELGFDIMRPGDRMLSVNEEAGVANMVQELKRAEHLTMTLRHPYDNTLKIEKQGRRPQAKSGNTCEWTDELLEDAVMAGDRIVSVNDIPGPVQLLQELKTSTRLNVNLIRPS